MLKFRISFLLPKIINIKRNNSYIFEAVVDVGEVRVFAMNVKLIKEKEKMNR